MLRSAESSSMLKGACCRAVQRSLSKRALHQHCLRLTSGLHTAYLLHHLSIHHFLSKKKIGGPAPAGQAHTHVSGGGPVCRNHQKKECLPPPRAGGGGGRGGEHVCVCNPSHTPPSHHLGAPMPRWRWATTLTGTAHYNWCNRAVYRRCSLSTGIAAKALTVSERYVLNEQGITQSVDTGPSVLARIQLWLRPATPFGLRHRAVLIDSYTAPHGIVVTSTAAQLIQSRHAISPDDRQ